VKAYITIGCPGSGKSTRAKELCSQNPNLIRINRDSIRKEILTERNIKLTWQNALKKEIESETSKRQDAAIRQAFRDGKEVVVDNCHLGKYIQGKIVRFLTDLGYTNIEILDFRDVPLETLLERNAKRTGFDFINPNVIRKMYNDHIEKTEMNNQTARLPRWEPLENVPNAIIVDVDGTLAEYVNRSPFDETRVYEDEVRWHILSTVKALLDSRTVDHLFIFSGRTNGCRQDTERWLLEKCELNNYSWSLHMRTVGDRRGDYFVKNDLFNTHIKDQWNVFAVFDDRQSVIQLWTDLNLPVFRCGVLGKDNF
jgi:predicted kinase